MKNVINFLAIILLFFSFIHCSKNTEKDEYEIVNLILQKNVTAYGVKIFPPKKIAFGSAEHKKFNDSLINSGNLTYHIVFLVICIQLLDNSISFYPTKLKAESKSGLRLFHNKVL